MPAALAKAMVAGGSAVVHNANGKVKSVMLVRTAASLTRIGPPTGGGWLAPRFSVREKLECGATVWKHHARATYG